MMTPISNQSSLPPVLGPYRILGHIGSGGMSQVYRAQHEVMKRDVALKVLVGRFLPADDIRARFEREVQVAAQLVHPNVVTAFDAGEDSGYHYLAMEYVAGTDLGRYVEKSGPLPILAACECVRQVAWGLQHAFEQGYVHGDIKPANMLLRESATSFTVKMLDFGLARPVGATGEPFGHAPSTDGSGFGGTPDFLAPEKARNDYRIDIRSDLYSLGCSFYYLLSGWVPCPGSTWSEKLVRHQFETPTPLARLRPEVPAEVCAIVERLLAKDPAERLPSPADLAGALQTVLSKLQPEQKNQETGKETSGARTSFQGEEPTWPSYHQILPIEAAAAPARVHRPSRTRRVFAGACAVALGLLLAWGYSRTLSPAPRAIELREFKDFKIELSDGRAFQSLNAAISAACDNEIITIHADGPFDLEPLSIALKSLTIRAANGCRPRIVYTRPGAAPSWRPLISAIGDMTLQGLELEMRSAPSDSTLAAAHLIYVDGGKLSMADCRLSAPGCQALVVCRQAASVELSRCQLTAAATPLCVEPARAGNAHIDVIDCDLRVADPQAAAIAIWGGSDSPVQLSLRGGSVAAARILSLARLSSPISIRAVGNRFTFQEALISMAGDETAEGIRKLVSWEGNQNRYENAGNWLMINGLPGHVQGLAAWREFWKSPDFGSHEKLSAVSAQTVSRAARF